MLLGTRFNVVTLPGIRLLGTRVTVVTGHSVRLAVDRGGSAGAAAAGDAQPTAAADR